MELVDRYILVCSGPLRLVTTDDGDAGFKSLLRQARKYASRPDFDPTQHQVQIFLVKELGQLSRAEFLDPERVQTWADAAAKKRKPKTPDV